MSKVLFFLAALIGSCLYFAQYFAGSKLLSVDPVIISGVPQGNNQPEVQFTAPKNGETFPLNSRVPYSLSISDPEDGESGYDEIPRNQVLLRVRYVKGDKLSSESDHTMENDPPGLLGILGSNCLNCHAFKSKLIGPSFLEISKKYEAGELEMELMASRIKNGSSGIWGPVVMPAHPELSDREIDEMLRWITKEADLDVVDYYTGTEGTFLTNPPAGIDGKGSFVLRAGYTDKGVAGKDRLKGENRITISVTEE